MRIVVVGTSGSGKTTLARRLAASLDLPVIELDAINWQPGWRSLAAEEADEFVGQVNSATKGETWVVEGGYSKVAPLLWSRATHLVWLDYDRPVIMARVLRRSLARALDGHELWAGTGNRESWRMWLSPEHPIRWAWDTWERRRIETEARLKEAPYAHLTVIRLQHPREAKLVLKRLRQPGQEADRSRLGTR